MEKKEKKRKKIELRTLGLFRTLRSFFLKNVLLLQLKLNGPFYSAVTTEPFCTNLIIRNKTILVFEAAMSKFFKYIYIYIYIYIFSYILISEFLVTIISS